MTNTNISNQTMSRTYTKNRKLSLSVLIWRTQATLLWYLQQAHRASRRGHYNAIPPANLWWNLFVDTVPYLLAPAASRWTTESAAAVTASTVSATTVTTDAVIALTEAALFMVAAAMALTIMMVSADVPTTVATTCTLSCGRDLWVYSRGRCIRCGWIGWDQTYSHKTSLRR